MTRDGTTRLTPARLALEWRYTYRSARRDGHSIRGALRMWAREVAVR